MASVSSLDADMRNLRLSRYTPEAASEIRVWIERNLGTTLPPGDLLDVLKDGVALCQLANLAIQPQLGAIKFKSSPMPFIQMENISHFLRACERPPLNMPAHDRFLTVDLYERKDPAQVLQCLTAFSRRAQQINPAKFPATIGPQRAGAATSPTHTGASENGSSWRRPPSPTKSSVVTTTAPGRSISPAVTGGSTGSQQSYGASSKPSSGPVSSWSNRSDEGLTSPAWNIHQYGYMGGASQGNQGISFGARRQITSQAPSVPSLTEKEKMRKEKEIEAERQQQQEAEEKERRRRVAEEEEERARLEEERKWEEETKRSREEERRRLEKQKKEWEEQERKWKDEEEARQREDAALQAKMAIKKPPEKPRVPSSSILRGQTLSEWQKEQAGHSRDPESAPNPVETPEQRRVRELEKQLEEARERERQYQAEREDRSQKEDPQQSLPASAQTSSARTPSARESETSWAEDERDYLRQQWQNSHDEAPPPKPAAVGSQRPLPVTPKAVPSLPQRPLPEPNVSNRPLEPESPSQPQPLKPQSHITSTRDTSSRPIPALPTEAAPTDRQSNRTDAYLSTHNAPSDPAPRISASKEAGDTSLEQSTLRDNRMSSQQKTKAGAWASKSLLEREMERERERQKEWEANQQTLKTAPRDPSQGTGEGQSWDVNQYGYMGGDNMSKGSSVGSGINIGGRRQIIGPRPKP